jgi:hypothetical protein
MSRSPTSRNPTPIIALVLLLGTATVGAPTASAAELPAGGELRVWKDRTGQHSLEARLEEIQEKAIELRGADGRTITVPIDRLSLADQKHVQRLRAQQEEEAAREKGIQLVNPSTLQVRIGLEATAQGGPCKNVTCSFPLPMDWPEQKVTIVDEEKSPLVRQTRMQVLNDGVKQCVFQIPRLPANATARVVYTLKIERWHISPPPIPELFVFARTNDPKLRPFLGESPFIEVRNPLVKSAAAGIELDETDTAWRQVETIYDWTRDKVHSDGTKPLKGALGALTSGTGDCEERTSLFVAMCRLKQIPARCVWIEGHAYPEFYLLDDRGYGHWIPCESLGARNFGGVQHYAPILQKGDNFRMSQKSGAQRYVAPTASCMLGRGSGTPVIREIRANVNADE